MNQKPTLMAELIAEFLGTFVLILFGTGVVAMVVLFPTKQPWRDHSRRLHQHHARLGDSAVTMGIYIAGKVSGAHLNPAVTLALAVFRGFPWRKVLPYSIAQTAGAFAAAALVYLELPAGLPPGRSATRRTLPEYSPRFPPFPAMPQAGFLDQTYRHRLAACS